MNRKASEQQPEEQQEQQQREGVGLRDSVQHELYSFVYFFPPPKPKILSPKLEIPHTDPRFPV